MAYKNLLFTILVQYFIIFPALCDCAKFKDGNQDNLNYYNICEGIQIGMNLLKSCEQPIQLKSICQGYRAGRFHFSEEICEKLSTDLTSKEVCKGAQIYASLENTYDPQKQAEIVSKCAENSVCSGLAVTTKKSSGSVAPSIDSQFGKHKDSLLFQAIESGSLSFKGSLETSWLDVYLNAASSGVSEGGRFPTCLERSLIFENFQQLQLIGQINTAIENKADENLSASKIARAAGIVSLTHRGNCAYLLAILRDGELRPRSVHNNIGSFTDKGDPHVVYFSPRTQSQWEIVSKFYSKNIKFQSNEFIITFKPEVMDNRLDFYGNNYVSYGVVTNSSASPKYKAGLLAYMNKAADGYGAGNAEIFFQNQVSTKYLEKILVPMEFRDGLIQQLKKEKIEPPSSEPWENIIFGIDGK